MTFGSDCTAGLINGLELSLIMTISAKDRMMYTGHSVNYICVFRTFGLIHVKISTAQNINRGNIFL